MLGRNVTYCLQYLKKWYLKQFPNLAKYVISLLRRVLAESQEMLTFFMKTQISPKVSPKVFKGGASDPLSSARNMAVMEDVCFDRRDFTNKQKSKELQLRENIMPFSQFLRFLQMDADCPEWGTVTQQEERSHCTLPQNAHRTTKVAIMQSLYLIVCIYYNLCI